MSRAGLEVVVFTDLRGSTEQRVRLGDERFDELRRDHDQLLTVVVERHYGEIVKFAGDGLMAVFDAAGDAIACAAEMQQAVDSRNRSGTLPEPLALAIGISAGDVAVEDGDYHGTPVVEAARLCGAGAPGQILVADVVRILAGTRVQFELAAVDALSLKGLPSPVAACEVRWAVSATPELTLAPRLGEAASAPFAGREAIVSEVEGPWLAARAGTRQCVLLAGEAGIGKTRMAARLAEMAATDGAVVVHGWCDQDLGAPYQPWVQALRALLLDGPIDLAEVGNEHRAVLARLVPELTSTPHEPPEVNPDTERYRMFDAVDAVLAVAADAASVVVVLDDLHWADQPTLALLRRVVQSDRPSRLMVVGTYRDTDVERGSMLADMLTDFRRDMRVTRIALAGLDVAAIAVLCEEVAGRALPAQLTERLHGETEGNAFFATEVVRHLIETGMLDGLDAAASAGSSIEVRVDAIGIPDTVRGVIEHRLDRLGEQTISVLRVAAVLGQVFELSLLAATMDRTEDEVLDALDEAAVARLVHELAGAIDRYTFSHALVQNTLADELGRARRTRLHRRVGELYESGRFGEVDEHLPALAYHWGAVAAAGGDRGKAVMYAVRAGNRAVDMVAWEEAVSYFRRARALLAADVDEGADRDEVAFDERAEVLTALAEVHRQLQEVEHVNEVVAELADLAEQAGRSDLLARGLRSLVLAASPQIENPLLERLVMALLKLEPSGDSFPRALALAAQAWYRSAGPPLQVDLAVADAAAEEARAIAERTGDPFLLAYAAEMLQWSQAGRGRPRLRLTCLGVAVDNYNIAGRKFDAEDAAGWMALAHFELGDRDSYDLAMEGWERAGVALHSNRVAAYTAMIRAGVALFDGDLAAAAEANDRMVQNAGEFHGFRVAHPVRQAEISHRSGEFEKALAFVEFALATLAEQFPVVFAEAARIYAEAGRPDDARRALRTSLPDGDFLVPPGWFRPRTLGVLAEAARRLGDVEAAELVHAELLAHEGMLLVTDAGMTFDGAADTGLALCEAVLGDDDAAEAHFRSGLILEERMGGWGAATRNRLFVGGYLAERGRGGDRAEAARHLEAARDQASARRLHGIEREAAALLNAL